MIQAKCIQKFRDNSGNIFGYRLVDAQGQTRDFRSNELKNMISKGKLRVLNLKLTSNGRLIDDTENPQCVWNELLNKYKLEPNRWSGVVGLFSTLSSNGSEDRYIMTGTSVYMEYNTQLNQIELHHDEYDEGSLQRKDWNDTVKKEYIYPLNINKQQLFSMVEKFLRR